LKVACQELLFRKYREFNSLEEKLLRKKKTFSGPAGQEAPHGAEDRGER
jgi:hypothetical protein